MRLIYGSLGALALSVVIAGCGGSSSYSAPSPTPTPTPTPTPAAGTIAIVGQNGNRSFNPSPATLTADGKMTFQNTDNTTHHIVANDGSWDTGNIAGGASSAQIQMPTTGMNYHCTIHPTMVGVINSSAGNTPPCTGQYC
jgi:plastocyanin